MFAREMMSASLTGSGHRGSGLEPRWLDVGQPAGLGDRLILMRRARTSPARGLVIQAHAFGEEQNKCRRMSAQQSKQLADAGFTVLQIDLLGCGDSQGDFGDATWPQWIDDLLAAARHGREIEPNAPLWWWGTRAGALLACEAARRHSEPCSLLFWQPTASGATALQQFLRLKAAGEMLAQGSKGVIDEVKRKLQEGLLVEIAGYEVGQQLTEGLSRTKLAPFDGVQRVVWLEVVAQAGAEWTPASTTAMKAWQALIPDFLARQVEGPTFWQTVETEDAPALWAATTQALSTGSIEPGPASSAKAVEQ